MSASVSVGVGVGASALTTDWPFTIMLPDNLTQASHSSRKGYVSVGSMS